MKFKPYEEMGHKERIEYVLGWHNGKNGMFVDLADITHEMCEEIERLRGALSEIVQAYDNDEGSNFLVLHRVQRMARQALEGEQE